MPPDTITIKMGHIDGKLDLSDNGYSKVDQFTRITWVIDKNSNVASIEKIHKKHTFPVLFVFGPSQDGDTWTGKVMFAPDKEYEYYIKWTEKGSGKSYTFDPKIAVKPGTFSFTTLVILVALIIIAIPTVRFFSRKINSK